MTWKIGLAGVAQVWRMLTVDSTLYQTEQFLRNVNARSFFKSNLLCLNFYLVIWLILIGLGFWVRMFDKSSLYKQRSLVNELKCTGENIYYSHMLVVINENYCFINKILLYWLNAWILTQLLLKLDQLRPLLIKSMYLTDFEMTNLNFNYPQWIRLG